MDARSLDQSRPVGSGGADRWRAACLEVRGAALVEYVLLVAFVALAGFSVPFPVVVGVAGLVGYLLGRYAPHVMAGGGGGGGEEPIVTPFT